MKQFIDETHEARYREIETHMQQHTGEYTSTAYLLAMTDVPVERFFDFDQIKIKKVINEEIPSYRDESLLLLSLHLFDCWRNNARVVDVFYHIPPEDYPYVAEAIRLRCW